MSNSLDDLIKLSALWLTSTAGLYGLFRMASENLKDETISKFSLWLLNGKLGNNKFNLSTQFIILFDNFFGNRHKSWRCFKRSVVVSASTFSIILVISSFFYPHRPGEYAMIPQIQPSFNGSTSTETIDKVLAVDDNNLSEEEKKNQREQVVRAVGTFSSQLSNLPYLILTSFLVSLIFNAIPDFISLLETRYVLKLMENTTSVTHLVLYLILDLLLTCLVYLILLFTLKLVFTGSLYGLDTFVLNSYNGVIFSAKDPDRAFFVLLGASFYTTLFTSVWIWLFFLISITIKVTSSFEIVLSFLKKYTKIESSPFRAIGFMLAAISILTYIIYAMTVIFLFGFA